MIGCDEGTNGGHINKKRGSTAGANSPLFLVYMASVLVTDIAYANMFVGKPGTLIILLIFLRFFIIRFSILIILPIEHIIHLV